MKRKTESKRTRKWRNLAGVLALVWMCVIFAFSAQTNEESSVVSEGISYRMVNSTGFLLHLNLSEEQLKMISLAVESFVRKGAHMTEYGILAILVFLWLGGWEMTALRRWSLAVAAAALYACSDEFHQLFVAGRAGCVTDVMIDSAGAALGLTLFVLLAGLWGRARKRPYKRQRKQQ